MLAQEFIILGKQQIFLVGGIRSKNVIMWSIIEYYGDSNLGHSTELIPINLYTFSDHFNTIQIISSYKGRCISFIYSIYLSFSI